MYGLWDACCGCRAMTDWSYKRLQEGGWGAAAFGRLGRQSNVAGSEIVIQTKSGERHCRVVAAVVQWKTYGAGSAAIVRLVDDPEIAAAADARFKAACAEGAAQKAAQRAVWDAENEAQREVWAAEKAAKRADLDASRIECRAHSVRVGEVFECRGEQVCCTGLGRVYCGQDTMSIYAFRSQPEDNEYRQYAYIRAATDTEITAARIAAEAARGAQDAARVRAEKTTAVRQALRAAATERPAAVVLPAGEEFWVDRHLNIYGGGDYALVGADGSLWCVERNGADGDNWSYNNCASSIARRVPDPEAALIADVRAYFADGGAA